jgi:hypothetical protein
MLLLGIGERGANMKKTQSQVQLERVLTQDSLEEMGPEIKSYIYQSILELEPYTTDDTTVTLLAKDPLQLISSMEEIGSEVDKKELKKMFRIAFVMQENDSKIETEAVHQNIFEAIKMAKEKMLAKLVEIHDSIVTAQDRQAEIQNVKLTGNVH